MAYDIQICRLSTTVVKARGCNFPLHKRDDACVLGLVPENSDIFITVSYHLGRSVFTERLLADQAALLLGLKGG